MKPQVASEKPSPSPGGPRDMDCWRIPCSSRDVPVPQALLMILLVIGHLVAIVELLCAFHVNSLCIFCHGAHLLINNIMLTGLITSSLVHWDATRRYSTRLVAPVIRLNLTLGALMYVGSVIVAYLAVWSLLKPARPVYEDLAFLVPVPAVLADVVASYVVRYGGHEEPAALNSICWHMSSNAVSGAAAILATHLVHSYGCVVADPLLAMFAAGVGVACSLTIIKESIEETADALLIVRPRPVYRTSEQHEQLVDLAKIFTV